MNIAKINIDKIKEEYLSGKSLQEVSEENQFSPITVRKYLNLAGISTARTSYFYRDRIRKYTIDDTIFEKIDTQEKAYILGFLYADGTLLSSKKQVRLKLQEKDRNILEKINAYLDYKKPLLEEYPKTTSKKQYNLIICSSKIYTDLLSHGLTPKKTFTCTFPNLDEDMLSHFIRGYFDGDGCIYVPKSTVIGAQVTVIGTTSFLKTLSDILFEYGITSHIYHVSKIKVGVDHLRINKISDVFNFFKFIYKDSPSLFLGRKYDKFLSLYRLGEVNI